MRYQVWLQGDADCIAVHAASAKEAAADYLDLNTSRLVKDLDQVVVCVDDSIYVIKINVVFYGGCTEFDLEFINEV